MANLYRLQQLVLSIIVELSIVAMEIQNVFRLYF